uniref:RRM domain-containing protein n=1 Tax=Anopheles atroparvus TaxID=41427 RepID=A0AAG5CTW5_ANOAO
MSLAMSSGGEKPDTTVTAATKRQIRQSVLGMLKKVDIKNKALKRFFLFTYDSIEPAVKQDSVKKGYFVNGEMCEGDEHFLQHMRKSLLVSNIPGGTKKSEIYQLFQRFGTVLSIQLSTRGGRTIIGQQTRQPNEYESEHYFCCTIEFDSSESAQNACEVKTEGNFIAKPIVDPSLTGTENCVYIENVLPTTTRQELWQHFKVFGPIRSIRMELPDGTLVLTDGEYAQLRSVDCHIRFRRRAEARAAAKGLNRSLFKERHLSVQMAYQKYCNPDELSNNALRIFFQPFGDVVALDQIPQQRAGYVCFKPPLPVDIIKRIHQLPTFRNRRITVEKLDLPGVPKDGSKAIKLLGNGKSSGRAGDGNGSGSSTSTSNNRSATSAIGGKTGSTLAAKLGRKLPRKSLPVGRKPLAKKAGGTTKSGSPSPAGKTAAKAAENAKENRETLP